MGSKVSSIPRKFDAFSSKKSHQRLTQIGRSSRSRVFSGYNGSSLLKNEEKLKQIASARKNLSLSEGLIKG